MLSPAGFRDQVEEINRRAVEAALRARDAAADADEGIVAGSIAHMVPVARGTAVVDPGTVPDEAAMADAFHELAQILANAGCELIIMEMMYHPGRIRLALEAAQSTGLPIWFGISVRRGADGRVVSFHQAEDLSLDEVTRLLPAAGVDAAGIMHSGADLVTEALTSVRRHFDGPLMAYPDSGYFEMPDWRFVDIISPDRFETFCRDWTSGGVQIIGGCCGLTVEHVKASVRARDALA
jgi:homocysteine S-methyltransferase